MSFERAHGDLHVVLTRDREGRIVEADLIQEGINAGGDQWLRLTPAQLYALVDDVAVADPDGWARRFPPQDETELALRRVADYFKSRAEANRRFQADDYFRATAGTFDLAVTRVMEEIEALYPDPAEDPTEHLNNYHQRRNA